MNAVDEKGLAIASEFEMFDEWMDKYNYLIELGKSLPLIDEKDKTTSNLISGCQSRVWLSANYENGKVYFKGDSDAIITKGIVSVLIRSMDGAGVDDIIASELDWLDNTGLKEHLSPTRSNGLVAMIKQMKLYAMAFKVKYENK
ncbi:MAG: SufE family protein [Sphingobacteriia bacterium]|jgi:cysteine desulfuration protein SufE|nr:SufE family protein [Sphingobacteriia bacterium]